tara:strand:+ start:1942 stop:2346 length:405 start_codon:yes stop_codon:yes gene_type:complete
MLIKHKRLVLLFFVTPLLFSFDSFANENNKESSALLEKLIKEQDFYKEYKILIIPKGKLNNEAILLPDQIKSLDFKSLTKNSNICVGCDPDKMVVPSLPPLIPSPSPTIKPFNIKDFCKRYPKYKACKENQNEN